MIYISSNITWCSRTAAQSGTPVIGLGSNIAHSRNFLLFLAQVLTQSTQPRMLPLWKVGEKMTGSSLDSAEAMKTEEAKPSVLLQAIVHLCRNP